MTVLVIQYNPKFKDAQPKNIGVALRGLIKEAGATERIETFFPTSFVLEDDMLVKIRIARKSEIEGCTSAYLATHVGKWLSKNIGEPLFAALQIEVTVKIGNGPDETWKRF
jgi:hypothetical protein